MPHGVVMFEQGPDLEALFGLTEQEHVRAVARDATGAALVFVHSEQTDLVAGAMQRIRGMSDATTMAGVLIGLPPLPVAVGHRPGPCTIFATVSLGRARQYSYGRYLQSVGPGTEGIEHAVCLVVGCRGVHALVEVVGTEWLGVLERLELLTAHEDVSDVRTWPVSADHVKGAGSELAWGT